MEGKMCMKKNDEKNVKKLRDSIQKDNLIQKIELIQMVGKGQEYALHACIIPELNDKTKQEYFQESIELFDYVIRANPEIAKEAYLAKIYTLYLKGEKEVAKEVSEEMHRMLGRKIEQIDWLFLDPFITP